MKSRPGTQAVIDVIEPRVLLSSYTLNIVASFPAQANVSTSYDTLALNSSGDLIGASDLFGVDGEGMIFKIAKGTSTITPLASFLSTLGSTTAVFNPDTPITLDSSGNVYGSAEYGPEGGADGAVWKWTVGASTVLPVAGFTETNGGGEFPSSTPIFDANGDIFGACPVGGLLNATNGFQGYGTAYEIVRGSTVPTTIATFLGTNGQQPEGSVVLDANENLFGTTATGGLNNCGTIYEVANGSNTITTLYNFPSNTAPGGGLITDTNGNLYGATDTSNNGNDTIFEIPHGSMTVTTIASFASTIGTAINSLNIDANGDFSGDTGFTLAMGGSHTVGSVFELAKGATTPTTLATFQGNSGTGGPSDLVLVPDGILYGTTNAGGTFGLGTVFELSTSTPIATATTVTTSNSSTIPGQSVTLTAAVSAPTIFGETGTVQFMDGTTPLGGPVSLNNVSGVGIYTTSALTVGSHSITAVYSGDATFITSTSTPITQTVNAPAPTLLRSPVVNGTGYILTGTNATLEGAQRSMVDSIEYTFSEAVHLSSSAFSIALSSAFTGSNPGVIPILTPVAVGANTDGSSTTWIVTFSGNGVAGGSIADGVYDITLNASCVTADNSTTTLAASRTDTFHRLFGDINGDGQVGFADNNAFNLAYGAKSTSSAYLAGFDVTGSDTKLGFADNNAFVANYGKKFKNVNLIETI